MSLKNNELECILPIGQPRDYHSLTDNALQEEITYCLHALSILGKADGVSFYTNRIKLAENELERRFLLF